MWFFAQFRLRFTKYFRSHKNGMVHDRKNGFVDKFLSVFFGVQGYTYSIECVYFVSGHAQTLIILPIWMIHREIIRC